MAVIGSPLGSMASSVLGNLLDLWYSSLLEQALTPTIELLVTSKIQVPLLHHWEYLAKPVIVVVHRHYCRVVNINFFNPLAVCIALPNTRAGPQERGYLVCSSSNLLYLEVLYLMCMMSSATVFHLSSRRQPNTVAKSFIFVYLQFVNLHCFLCICIWWYVYKSIT